jgi:hypothetical protein
VKLFQIALWASLVAIAWLVPVILTALMLAAVLSLIRLTF